MQRCTVRMKGLGAASLSVLALGLSPSLAAAQSTVQLGSQAQLAARGAAIILPITITCGPGAFQNSPNVIQVTQRVGKNLAKGSSSGTQVICDSAPHVTDLFIQAQDHPFKTGTAAAAANFTFCESMPVFSCRAVNDSKEITIVK
jgi:hypothetical protein